jgi:hypothetical protein
MTLKDSNVEATRKPDERIGTEGATGHSNTRRGIKLNDHRAVM